MPHTFIEGHDKERVLQNLKIHIEYVFKKDVYQTLKSYAMMEEINEKIGEIVRDYFKDYSEEEMSNLDYYIMKNLYNYPI